MYSYIRNSKSQNLKILETQKLRNFTIGANSWTKKDAIVK